MPRYIREIQHPDGTTGPLVASWHPTDEDVAHFVGATPRGGSPRGTRIRIWVAPNQEMNTEFGPQDVAGPPIIDYTAR